MMATLLKKILVSCVAMSHELPLKSQAKVSNEHINHRKCISSAHSNYGDATATATQLYHHPSIEITMQYEYLFTRPLSCCSLQH